MAHIDEQYSHAVNKAVEALTDKQTNATLNLIFVTDFHHSCGGNQLRAARAIRELTLRLPLDVVVNGGDSAINETKDRTLASQMEICHALRTPEVPVLTVKGNHDDNSIFGHDREELRGRHVIFPSETRRLIQDGVRHAARWDETRSDTLYYFVDVEAKQTRVIVLDTIDIPYADSSNGTIEHFGQWEYAFSPEQLNWFAHEALNLQGKPDWRVLIVSHVAILQDEVFGADFPVRNGEALWGVLCAFRDGSSYAAEVGEGEHACRVAADFGQQGRGTVIGCLFGHVHFDQTVYREGIPLISTLNACTSRDFPEAPERTVGTLSETAFDIVTVNFGQTRIDTYRFGAGEHRSISF